MHSQGVIWANILIYGNGNKLAWVCEKQWQRHFMMITFSGNCIISNLTFFLSPLLSSAPPFDISGTGAEAARSNHMRKQFTWKLLCFVLNRTLDPSEYRREAASVILKLNVIQLKWWNWHVFFCFSWFVLFFFFCLLLLFAFNFRIYLQVYNITIECAFAVRYYYQ